MTYRNEEIRDVVRYVHRNTHVGKVESVAQCDQGDGDDMVQHQLAKVLPRLLELQEEHKGLQDPEGGLDEVVCLEVRFVCTVREAFVHADDVKVPDGGAAHQPDAVRADEGEVDGEVRLFHEARNLALAPNAEADGHGTDEALHEEFAGEEEDDGVEGDKGNVSRALAVLRDIADVGGEGIGSFVERRVGVREENGGVEGVMLAGGDEVEGEDGGGEDQRDEPGVLEGCSAEAADEVLCLLALATSIFRMRGLWRGKKK